MQQFFKKHGLALIVWIVVVLVATLTMPNVTQLVKKHSSVALPSSVQSEVAKTIDRKSENNRSVRSLIVVFNKKDGQLNAQNNQQINQAISNIKSDSNLKILDMTSASDNAQAKKQLASKDGTTQLAMVSVSDHEKVSTQAKQLRSHLKIHGLRTYVTGADLLNDDFSTTTQAGLKKTEIIAAVFIFIVLILVFRSIIIPFISLLTVGVSYLVSSGIVMNLADKFNFPLSNFTQIFMVVVLFGIGTDYNILLYNRFKEELANGLGADEAATVARKHAGRTILYSGSSVFIGFLVLALAKFSFYRSAVGVAVGVLVLLPVLLTLNMFFMATLGKTMFWPSKDLTAHGKNPFWHFLSKSALNHTAITVVIMAVVIVPLLLVGNQKLNFNSADELSNSIESKAGYNLINKHFPAGMSGPSTFYIESSHSLNNQKDLAAIDNLTNYLKAEPGVKQVSSVTQPGGTKIKQLYLKDQLGQLVTGLNQANQGLTKVQAGLKSADQQLAAANSSSNTAQLKQLISGTGQLQSGAQQLNQGIAAYTAGVGQLSNGASRLSGSTTALTSSIGQLSSGSQQLTQGLNQMQAQTRQLPMIQAGTGQLATGSAQLSNGLGQLNSQTSPFATGVNQLNSGASQLAQQGNALNVGAKSVANGSTQVNAGVQQLATQVGQLQAKTRALQQGLASANTALGKISQGTTTASSYLKGLQSSYVGNDFYIPKSTLGSSTFKPSLDAFMSSNRKIAKITIILNSDPSTTKAANQIRTISSDTKASLKHGALKNDKVAIGGESSRTADLQRLSNGDFIRTVVIMLIGIGIALIFVTRSLIQPLTIIATLVTTYVSALTLTRLLSKALLAQNLLTWNTPFFSFIMITALGVDYSIFLMMRYRDDAAKIPDVRRRILNASAIIGTVVISAAIILGGTFAALIPSNVLTLIQVAMTVIIGLIILVILLPITMSIMVKWTYPYVTDKMYTKAHPKNE
ncbi:membrane protein [Secundilactobacillus silagincola]|uniref:Membrane protein n=1 Tax=Secundilactobacillus silagincola TaxID=1714681 RepID=A0A1Z5J084_9LACO|nr:MMPL family transporter [Secundilactobacillus silagincola]GAX07306.1 membrane protein [Secundilactobacillus silagincola]